ncbi:MAG: hypothetical protein ACFB0D_23790 [Phormidesmis sp.]
MFNRFLKTTAVSLSLGVLTVASAFSPAIAAPKENSASDGPAGFTLWNDGEMSGIAFDVWTRPARDGGGFYYFLWAGEYADITNHARPEVAVFFDSNIATVNGAWLTDCYADASYRTECQNAAQKPSHVRSRDSIPAPIR